MLTKSKIALSALLAVGFASAALASEPVEYRIGDQYPFLEQIAQPQQDGSHAYASATGRHDVAPFSAIEQAQFDRASGKGMSW